ncbi:rRNA maturation RNase YbeY [Planktotalea sp.]|uniref:rRNA maturation RNase YbeY n=1 Tax=Planktotalea sp. TaxID=2029877 RepID=UPI0025E77911|nr:rRNA maturation RNase YbeY [Planktotalea sp.]
MLTDTIIKDSRWQTVDLATLAETAARQTLTQLNLDPTVFEIAILACDDTRIAKLNTEFRDKPTPTNVLSWPSDERASDINGARPEKPVLPMDAELGDIAISYDTCAREAQVANKALTDHATHLIIHGVLHLLGYDHIRDLDATLMEQTEVLILGTLGIGTPY